MVEYIKYKYIEKKDTDQLTYESYINKNFSNANNSGIIKYQPVTQNNETTDTTSSDRTFPTFRVANSKINLDGIIRYNYFESRFEICKSNVFYSLSENDDGTNGNSYFKRLNFSSNYHKDKNIINKGNNKKQLGNIFKDIKVVPVNNVSNKFIDYNSDLIYSNPSFIYNFSNLFDIYDHNITFKPNDTSSYKVYVRKNYNFNKSDLWNSGTSIKLDLINNSFYEYTFEDYFPFYGNKFKKMYINKLGYISFLHSKQLINQGGIELFDMINYSKDSISSQYGSNFTNHKLNFEGRLNINSSENTTNGNGATIDFTLDSSNFINPNTIKINNIGSGYRVGDILTIEGTKATLVVKKIKEDIQYINYKDCLKDYRISFFNSDLQINSTNSDVYISKGHYNEIIITFSNIYHKDVLRVLNFQIRLWDNSSKTLENTFKNSSLYFSDDYFPLGSIEISYYISTITKFIVIDRKMTNMITKFDNVFIGLSNYIDYNLETFKPLNFGNLIDKTLNFKNSKGVPNLKARLIFKSDININDSHNRYTKNSANTIFLADIRDYNVIESENHFEWVTSYTESNGPNKYYIKIVKLTNINLVTLSGKIKKILLAISSENDENSSYSSLSVNHTNTHLLDEENKNKSFTDMNGDILTVENESILIDIEEIKSLGGGSTQNKDFITVYNNNHLNSKFFDSEIYKIELRIIRSGIVEGFNFIFKLDLITDSNLSQNLFLVGNDSEVNHEELYMKVIFRLGADKVPSNTSFDYAEILDISTLPSNNGPYNLVKNYSNYYKVLLGNAIYTIELLHNYDTNKISVGLVLELYTSDKIIIDYAKTDDNGGFPGLVLDNMFSNGGSSAIFYLKVYGNMYHYFNINIKLF